VGRHRTPSGREANPQKGRDYAEAVIRFMATHGYVCTNRAEISGDQADLEFEPKVSGRPVIAEAKHRGQNSKGLSPKKYKKGFAEYFVKWAPDRETQFQFFISKEANPQLWRKLFREEPDSETVREYFEQLQDEVGEVLGEDLSMYDVETFEDFAADTTVWNFDYVELMREADRAERSGDFNYEPYLTSCQPIRDGNGSLSTNLFEITHLPTTVYRFDVADDASHSSFYASPENRRGPFELEGGNLHSLLPRDEMPESAVAATDGEGESRNFESLATQSDPQSVNLVKALLRGLLTQFAEEAGATVSERQDGRVTVVYMPLSEGGSREEKKVGGRWLAKQADKHPVVRHRAVEIGLRRFSGTYYYSFMPSQEFTEDGHTLVQSQYKDDLVDDFSRSRHPQNDRQRKILDTWGDILNPGGSVVTYSAEQPQAIRDLQFTRVEGIETNCRPPKDGEERDTLLEQL